MSQDYDQFEKVFNGTWKHDRDENLEAFMVAVGKFNAKTDSSPENKFVIY